MIRPENVKLDVAPIIKEDDFCEKLENQFDEAITRAEQTGRWPIRIYPISGCSAYNLDKTIEKYNQAGWHITEAKHYVIVLHKPNLTALIFHKPDLEDKEKSHE